MPLRTIFLYTEIIAIIDDSYHSMWYYMIPYNNISIWVYLYIVYLGIGFIKLFTLSSKEKRMCIV